MVQRHPWNNITISVGKVEQLFVLVAILGSLQHA
jgi:hypothetical protein